MTLLLVGVGVLGAGDQCGRALANLNSIYRFVVYTSGEQLVLEDGMKCTR
jgi:hypothetical protein